MEYIFYWHKKRFFSMLLFIIECASEINYSNMMCKNYGTRVKLVKVCMKLLLPELLDDGVFSVITVC